MSQHDPCYKVDKGVASWEYVRHSRDPQRPNEQLAMRVYLNPKLEMTPTVFAALLQELPTDAYYHMKTNDMAYTKDAMDTAVSIASLSPDFALPELLELPPDQQAQRIMNGLGLPPAPSP